MDARKTAIAIHAAMAATVLLATFTHFPRDWKPVGVESPVPAPSLKPRALLSGDFGAGFERFFAQKVGLRGYGIRLANQLSWDVFGVLPSPRGTAIDVGSDFWLYEHEYVRHNVHLFEMRESEAVEFAGRMAALKEKLAKKGVPLVVCVSPSKVAVYPEHLLDGMRTAPEFAGNTPARDTLIAHLRKAGIAVVDSRTLFLDWKRDGVLLFPKNGTHWDAYGAQRIWNEIAREARGQNPGFPEMPEVVGSEDSAPMAADGDLAMLHNMIRFPREEKTVPYPVLADAPPPEHRVRVLGVGDSFSFQLADAMGRSGAVESFRLLYYNSSEYRYAWRPGERPRENEHHKARKSSIDARAFDLDAAIQDIDLVLVELNDVFARKRAWLFALER